MLKRPQLPSSLKRPPAPPPPEDAARGRALDAAAEAVLAGLSSLSDLTAPLAISYLDRIGRPTPWMTPEAGVLVTSAGYAAHMAVEADGGPFGVTTLAVLGTLPDLRRGRPPQDLLLRVVKATRKTFSAIRAVDELTWEGFVSRRMARVGEELDRPLVDGLLRFGWVLRQVDLRYGLEPETTG